MISTALMRLTMHGSLLPREVYFKSIIYAGGPAPCDLDIRRQCLAFGCALVLQVWVLMNWSMRRVTMQRLVTLRDTKWRLNDTDFAEIIYGGF
jgi:hypothetical protein